jgi:hypothetical protein
MSAIDKIKTTDPDLLSFADLFRDHDIEFIDESVKITESDFITDRLQIMLRRDKIKFLYVLGTVLPTLNFPPRHAQSIANVYYKQDKVGFGIEKNESGEINYRIYFEKNVDRSAFDSADKVLSMFSHTWNASDSQNITTSNYYLEKYDTLEEIEQLFIDSELKYFPHVIEAMKERFKNKKYFARVNSSYDGAMEKRTSLHLAISELKVSDLLVGEEYGEEDIPMFPTDSLYYHLNGLYEDAPLSFFSVGADNSGNKYHTLYFRVHKI